MPPPRKKSHSSKRKRKPLSRIFKRHSTLFTSLTVFIVGLFIWSIFFDNDNKSVKVVSTVPSIAQSRLNLKDKNTDNNSEILKLTKRLLAEKSHTEKLTKELQKQNLKLKTLLKKTLDKTNKNDQQYIDALSKMRRFKRHAAQSNHTLAQTDYYNKVRVSLSNNVKVSQIQQQVNQLIQQKEVNKKGKYLKTLKKEAIVRRNQVRSIVLKKGDTLWALARRAYGKGALYPKILKANPQITKKNIRRLRVGTVIRVPL